MTETTTLFEPPFKVENPLGVTTADIAIFILSSQDAGNIEIPTRKAGQALKKFYPDLNGVVINCDNNSDDGIHKAFFSAECEAPRMQVTPPPTTVGRGANIRNIFPLAHSLKARVTMVFDASLTSIKTTWIKSLADPILAGHADYITPLYIRHHDDAPLTRNLAYPLCRSLFGRRVLQPLAVDHAFSPQLVELYLKQNWELNDDGYKADLKMLSLAIMTGTPICQAFMAHPRLVTAKEPRRDQGRLITAVVNNIFTLMGDTFDYWRNIKISRATVVSGLDQTPLNLPPHAEVNVPLLKQSIATLTPPSRLIWDKFFSPELLKNMEQELSPAFNGLESNFPTELWRDLVFETALAFQANRSCEIRYELSESLLPLFFLRRLAVYSHSRNFTNSQSLTLADDDALIFEQGKKKLVEKWAN